VFKLHILLSTIHSSIFDMELLFDLFIYFQNFPVHRLYMIFSFKFFPSFKSWRGPPPIMTLVTRCHSYPTFRHFSHGYHAYTRQPPKLTHCSLLLSPGYTTSFNIQDVHVSTFYTSSALSKFHLFNTNASAHRCTTGCLLNSRNPSIDIEYTGQFS